MKKLVRGKLIDIYNRLYAHFGPRHWWPAQTPFEVMVGAILTQNTAWSNVEKAIRNLKKERALTPGKIRKIPQEKLATLIRPSGFYNEKAKKLKEFVKFLKPNAEYSREELLNIKGIGKETADSILLYAFNKPAFVVDAYTKRIFSRHYFLGKNADYDEIQRFFTGNLPNKTKLFNEYHALIVELGKNYCKKNSPICKICPLSAYAREVPQ